VLFQKDLQMTYLSRTEGLMPLLTIGSHVSIEGHADYEGESGTVRGVYESPEQEYYYHVFLDDPFLSITVTVSPQHCHLLPDPPTMMEDTVLPGALLGSAEEASLPDVRATVLDFSRTDYTLYPLPSALSSFLDMVARRVAQIDGINAVMIDEATARLRSRVLHFVLINHNQERASLPGVDEAAVTNASAPPGVNAQTSGIFCPYPDYHIFLAVFDWVAQGIAELSASEDATWETILHRLRGRVLFFRGN
jgi:hypothetical protein